MWLGPTSGEGAKHWLSVLTELKNRGILDACIVCCDGLKGLPDAVNAAWPEVTLQTCVAHLVRNSLRLSPRKDWQKLTPGTHRIYIAPTPAERAQVRFDGTPRASVVASCRLTYSPLGGRTYMLDRLCSLGRGGGRNGERGGW